MDCSVAIAIGPHLLPFEADNWRKCVLDAIDGLKTVEKNSAVSEIRLHDRCKASS